MVREDDMNPLVLRFFAIIGIAAVVALIGAGVITIVGWLWG